MGKSKIFYATLTYFIIFVLFIVIRMLSSFGLLSFGAGSDYLFTFIVQVVLLLGGSMILFPALTKQKRSDVLRGYGVKRLTKLTIFLSILLGICVFFINGFVSDFFNNAIELFGYEHSYGAGISSYSFASLLLNLLFTAALPAICEEFAHRGMLLKSYIGSGGWKAIIITSLLFGLLHLNIEQFFYATLIGLFLGYLTAMSGSIIPAIIVHFMNNALSTYRTFSIVNGLPFGKAVLGFESLASSNIFLYAVLSAMLLVVLVYCAYRLTNAILRRRRVEEAFEAQIFYLQQLMRREYLVDLDEAIKNVSGKGSDSFELETVDLKQVVEEKYSVCNEKATPLYAKVLLYITLAMGVALTIFTFVWGAI